MADVTGEHPRPFGVAALMEAIEGIRFPASRERIVSERGDREVEVRHGHKEQLRTILLRCDRCEDFASFEDLLSQVEHVV